MQNKIILKGLLAGSLMLTFFSLPQISYADWGVGVSIGGPGYHHDDRHFYRWHEHPQYGLHMHFLPDGYLTIHVGFHRYYYYDGLYYNYVGGDYVLVAPPVGAYVSVIPPDFQPVLINGRTYYTDNGVYYLLTKHHGYKVVVAPVVYAHPVPAVVQVQAPVAVVAAPAAVVSQETFTINVPNSSGGYVAVVLKRSGNGYVGPQGEFYSEFPKVTQLKIMYGK